jgi:hypothetical protein
MQGLLKHCESLAGLGFPGHEQVAEFTKNSYFISEQNGWPIVLLWQPDLKMSLWNLHV